MAGTNPMPRRLGDGAGQLLRAGPGIRLRHLNGVIIVEADPRAFASPRVPPFTVTRVNESRVRVKPGTVNSELPVTVGGAEDEDWLFDVPATRWVYLEVEMAGNGSITAKKLHCAAAVPAQPEGDPDTGAAPASSYQAVAKITIEGDTMTIDNFLSGSQWVQTRVSQWDCDTQTVRVQWSAV